MRIQLSFVIFARKQSRQHILENLPIEIRSQFGLAGKLRLRFSLNASKTIRNRRKPLPRKDLRHGGPARRHKSFDTNDLGRFLFLQIGISISRIGILIFRNIGMGLVPSDVIGFVVHVIASQSANLGYSHKYNVIPITEESRY